MIFSRTFFTALLFLASGPLLVSAAPTSHVFQPRAPTGDASGRVQAVASYYATLGTTIFDRIGSESVSTTATCNLNKAVLPVQGSSLSAPGPDMKLAHVVLGHGTQNYTCASEDGAPVATGAVALLYDGNCLAANHPALLHSIPAVLAQYPAPPFPSAPSTSDLIDEILRPLTLFSAFTANSKPYPSQVKNVGEHFFTSQGVPRFIIGKDDSIDCKKDEQSPAPASSVPGANVPWLKLSAKAGSQYDFDLVYRVHTAGGVAPTSCKGQPKEFAVNYGTEYWLYKKN